MAIFLLYLTQEEDRFIQDCINLKMENLITVEQDQLILLADWAAKLTEVTKPILFVGNDLPIHRTKIEELLRFESNVCWYHGT